MYIFIKNLKYNLFAIILFLFTLTQTIYVKAQLTKREAQVDILKLREYAIEYDIYGKTNDPKYIEKKNIATRKYNDQIHKIKNGSNKTEYLRFLDIATGVDSAKYKNNVGFNYTDISTNPFLTNNIKKRPTMLEYFKVVKYSLFTLNKNELVLPKDVPFLRSESK